MAFTRILTTQANLFFLWYTIPELNRTFSNLSNMFDWIAPSHSTSAFPLQPIVSYTLLKILILMIRHYDATFFRKDRLWSQWFSFVLIKSDFAESRIKHPALINTWAGRHYLLFLFDSQRSHAYSGRVLGVIFHVYLHTRRSNSMVGISRRTSSQVNRYQPYRFWTQIGSLYLIFSFWGEIMGPSWL